MKKYIKASISSSSQELKSKLKGLKSDFLQLARCETLEDVQTALWSYWNVGNFIQRKIDKGQAVEEAIDDMLDSIYQDIQTVKSEIEYKVAYEERASKLMTELEHLDSLYDLVGNNGEIMIFNAPEGATHQDCIEFVDDVVSAIKGRYTTTGRGGSWTAWDLQSASGVRFKAGWYEGTGSNKWFIEVM